MTNNKSDVIIIGAGIMGCSTAYYLAKRGVSVTVLEAKEVAAGASGANGSGTRENCRDSRERPLATLAMHKIWPNLSDELEEDIEFVRAGNLTMGKTDEHEAILKKLVEDNVAGGVNMRMVYGKDVFEIHPGAAPDVTCGAFAPTDGHANPMKTTLAFYMKAKRLGARFIMGERVLGLKKYRGAVRQVIAEHGVYEADRVILCANLHSREIMRTVGLDIPMLAINTEACITEPLPHLTDTVFSGCGWFFYGSQQHNGAFIFGGDSTYELYDANYELPMNLSFSASRINRFLLDFVPALKGVKVIRTWSALLDMSWDNLPTISEVEEVPGLFLACGFTGHGFGIGPAVGYVLSQMAVGEETAVDLSPLRYDRFRKPSH